MTSNKPAMTDFQSFGFDALNKGMSDLITHFFEVQNIQTKKTFKSLLFGLCILIGADCFKIILQNFLKEQQKIINDALLSAVKSISIVDFFNAIYYIFTNSMYYFMQYMKNIVSTLLRKKQPKIQNEIVEVKPFINIIDIAIVPNKTICESLMNYIKNDKTAKYDEEYATEIIVGENDSVDIGVNYQNIELLYEGMKIEIASLNKNGKCVYENTVFSKKNIGDLGKQIFYPTDFDVFLTESNDGMFTIAISGTYIYFIENMTLFGDNYYSQSFRIIFYLIIGQKKFNDFKRYVRSLSNDKLRFYLATCHVIYVNSEPHILSRILKLYNLLRDSHFTFAKQNYACVPGYILMGSRHTTEFIKSNLYKELCAMEEDSPKTSNQTTTTNLPITISSPTLTTKELYQTFSLFIDHVKKSSKLFKTDAEVKIFTITVKSNEIPVEHPNAEYKKYCDKREKIQKSIQVKNPDITEKELQKELLNEIGTEPDKIIMTTKIEKTIETNETNKKYHSFNNLYLHNGQDKELFDLCNKFKNDKVTRKRLGIPNKLVICLYGEPGTGKSTTIATLGSLLGRDIFYVNINGYKNEDVKMIFDHVNKIHQGGGIIALEDFDAQSDVVKSSPSGKSTIHELMETKNDNVTLDFLLNIFDGTLVQEDSIIIMTTNHPELFCKEMMRAGRVDKMIEMKRCDHYQIKKMYKNFMEREIRDDVLEKIKENAFIPAEIIAQLALCYGKDLADEIVMEKFIDKTAM